MLGGTTDSRPTWWIWLEVRRYTYKSIQWFEITRTRKGGTKMLDCLKNPTQKWPNGHVDVHQMKRQSLYNRFLQLPLYLTEIILFSVVRPGAAPRSRERSRRFVVPVPREGPLPPPVSGERPASTATEAPPTWRSSPRWWATPPVVISVSRTSAPWRGSATGAAALLAIGQLYPYPATTQCPSIKLTHSISCISGIFKFYKGEAWGVPSHPDTAKRTIVTKCSL